MSNRLSTEKKVVKAMIKIYCKANHKQIEICDDCNSLIEYALLRTDRCRYHENKPACKNCQTHCYNKENRNKIIEIMQFSGKRIVFRNPILSLKHLLNGFN